VVLLVFLEPPYIIEGLAEAVFVAFLAGVLFSLFENLVIIIIRELFSQPSFFTRTIHQ
jgi:hypothetical protein